MTQTQPSNAQETTPEIAVSSKSEGSFALFSRMGSFLLLFSAVFVGILGISWTFVLPHLTRLQVDGKTVELSAVLPYERQLNAQIIEAEAKRNEIVLPVNDSDFETLKHRARCYPPLEDLRSQLIKTANTFGDDVVLFQELTFDASGMLSISGDIRNVGPRSMTVLAQFVDALKDIPFFTAITPPLFLRQGNASIGFYSPFSITLTLRASDDCSVTLP